MWSEIKLLHCIEVLFKWRTNAAIIIWVSQFSNSSLFQNLPVKLPLTLLKPPYPYRFLKVSKWLKFNSKSHNKRRKGKKWGRFHLHKDFMVATTTRFQKLVLPSCFWQEETLGEAIRTVPNWKTLVFCLFPKHLAHGHLAAISIISLSA